MEVFVLDVGCDQLSLENNGGSFSALAWPSDAVPDAVVDVSAVNVVVPENESVAVFTLNMALLGSAAPTAGMNAVVTISTAMRREKALSIRFKFIDNHPGTGGRTGKLLSMKRTNTSCLRANVMFTWLLGVK
ncbi:hypothetical protein [Methanoculleus sp.]|jgi:hypothetical protein|uniref:hypothetical protein n=1 Tax=Methanoculleus sp. TaxID=90427 RepID=UPI0025F5F0BD|nr:hypothetical protein [Methanoculleus sp.]